MRTNNVSMLEPTKGSASMRNLLRYGGERWFPIITALAVLAGPARAQSEVPSGAALVKMLRQGGYVLVMRHASSSGALPDKAAADPENVTGERQLDETGRTTARAMGDAITTLKIPIANVLSSPTYRARETVRLAGLGTPETVAELDSGAPNSVDPHAIWLRHRVTVKPPAGSNTLIVTHAPNILGAFAQSAVDLSDGETLLFRPHGRGVAPLVARIKIEDWPHFAAENAAPQVPQ